ncbi:UNVERIFIED_CONTAM: glycoside hydrolase family 95 protein, partial [Bacteroidetes bacterium 56_B9]
FFTGQHGMPFQTIGSLMLEFDGHADYSNYRRDLDLERAVASVRYKIGEVNYTRTIFTSLVDNALIIRIEADKPGAVNFTTRYSTPYKEYE